MIAVGLSWRMAIGACVLGNFLMGLVITTNGRIGALVSSSLRHHGCPLTDSFVCLSTAAHSIPGPRSHALWLLLQLLYCAVPLCPCHCLARVSLPLVLLRCESDGSEMPYSVQTTTGGQCMTVLLTAIWPSFKNIPNHIPESEGITTAGMVGFLLYFLLQLPFLCIPYTKVLLLYPTLDLCGLEIRLTAAGSIFLCLQECHRSHHLPGCLW